MNDPTLIAQWQQLIDHSNEIPNLETLFENNDKRVEDFLIDFEGVCFDYSKQLIDKKAKKALIELAEQMGLKDAIDRLVSGYKVNTTENRPALHTALRLPKGASLVVDDVDIAKQVHRSLANMARIVERLTSGTWRGYSGKKIKDIVNIGVGGSDLGPLMTCTALSEWTGEALIQQKGLIYNSIETHFVSNMDGTQLDKLLITLNPETTVFIISSKSFTTSDTLSNAETALAWLTNSYDNKSCVKRNHFIGISANTKKMNDWGIHTANQLKLWDWVGGRFSMWSSIGLTVAIRIGMENFKELLAGAHLMDKHFVDTSFADNIPVMMGLLGVWNSSFLDINAQAVLPYDGRLKYFPNYLTQLEMESNGKSVNLNGQKVTFDTCAILWGEVGSNAQHAFYQLLHQGTQNVACDFIAFIDRYDVDHQNINQQLLRQHKLSLANCLAQSRVLAFGNAAVGIQEPCSALSTMHKNYRGNQPSSTILINKLSPKTLGMLLAMYEHKVYVMSVMWGVNPFDQWGVEIGKVMANQLNDAIYHGTLIYDDSTNALLQRICNL